MKLGVERDLTRVRGQRDAERLRENVLVAYCELEVYVPVSQHRAEHFLYRGTAIGNVRPLSELEVVYSPVVVLRFQFGRDDIYTPKVKVCVSPAALKEE